MNEATRPTVRVKGRSKERAKQGKFLTGLIAIVVLVPVLTAGSYAVDAMFDAPWAYGLWGQPSLTGTWKGQFKTPSGIQFALYMDLRHPVLSNQGTGALITGGASWCNSEGQRALNIPIYGAVPILTGYNGTANEVELDLNSAGHPQPGLQPDTLAGKWQDRSLVLQPTFSFWTGSGFEYSRNYPDLMTPITITLKKSDETGFRAACAAIGNPVP